MDYPIWNHPTFSKNRNRLMASNFDEFLFETIKKQTVAKQLLSRARDQFTVDGTLLNASASMESLKLRNHSGL